MRAVIAVGLVLAVALTVQGALNVQQTVTTGPAATVPVTLSAIGGVDTLLGGSLTNATVGSVTPVVLPLLASSASILQVNRGIVNWSVQLRINGASGLVTGDSITMSLVGATTQAVTVTPSTSLPVTSGAVNLTTTGTNITIKAASGVPIVGGCGGLGSCTLTMHLVLTPQGGTYPLILYPISFRGT